MTSPDELQVAYDWFAQQGWAAFPFQRETWQAYLAGQSGLVNAPTGSGKTYALIVPILLEGLREQQQRGAPTKAGLRAIWITPIRALAREIEQATRRAI
ncbi:MAG: DEAD/DEAH box helicase, partial [Bacteroidetes bacterium]